MRIPEEEKDRYDGPDLSEDATLDISATILSSKHVIKPMPQFGPVPFWGYGLRSACWDILAALFRPDLTDLFYICLSLRIDPNSILYWGHEYGGAVYVDRRYWGLPELHRRPLSCSPLRGFTCDPFNIPAIQSSFKSSASQKNYRGEALAFSDDIKIDRDIFKRLPPEIMQDIVIRLY
ncbi:hypothetical protein B0J15DRAFT_551102 [Fusarium solani]|uniref:Uncharacterized protein n=1 Tax=Fusarium solani TaxID=169388 RepID=A0A9P9GZ10_FUSSL|nr:uncharacterized protein B0J15DRAFT_551102 [Fusarium solani]KAH7248164.1 hypothetical protein B0J15DRAFT_551102 [Fusarium solani]